MANDFEKAAAAADEENLFTEFWGFLRYNKKWWLLPVLAVLLMMGAIMVLGSTGAGPWIYSLF